MSESDSGDGGLQPSEIMSQSDFRLELTEAIPHMRAFARSLTGDAASADDLAQDALMKAWSARAKFKAGTNFRAWVLTIVRNQFYSDKRRSWRQADWDQELAERTLPSVDNQEQVVALDELRRGLAELPDDQREALILVGAGGYSYDEAAAICGCATGTVKSRVSRARLALEGIMKAGPAAKANTDGVAASDAVDTLLGQVSDLAEQVR